MTIEDIEQVDAPSGGAARVMRITTGGGAFATPARMISHGEQAARSAIPLSRALPDELAVDFGVVRAVDAAALAAGGAAAAAPGLRRRARLHRDITERALLSVSVLQPSAAALACMTAPALVRFADAQAELLRGGPGGGGGGGGLVTYPYLGLRAGDYLRFVRERRGRDGEGAALFVLDMGMDGATMEKILDCLGGDGAPALVPLIHRGASGPPSPPPGRSVIGRHPGRPKMAFLACQVPREAPAGECSVSGLHAACFQHGFDMAAPAQQQRPPPPPRRRSSSGRPDDAAGGARFFSPETWRIDPLADALASRGMRLVDEFLLGEHNGPDRMLVASVLGGGAAAAPPARRPLLLRQLARVHEAISSSAEFGRMRAAISERKSGSGAPEIAPPPLVRN